VENIQLIKVLDFIDLRHNEQWITAFWQNFNRCYNH